MEKQTFEQRYQDRDIPWDREYPDYNLINMAADIPLDPCRVLDLGCGTGINSVWLAQHGFDVTGLDLSPTAVSMAEKRASAQEASIHFIVGDFLQTELSGRFDLVFDRGCFHSFDSEDLKSTCAARIAASLAEDGLWISLIGNADDTPREIGPPTLSAADICRLVEPYFEILSLTAGYFGGGQDAPPKAWVAVMKKRP